MSTTLQPPHNPVDLTTCTGAQHAMAALIDAGLEIPAIAFERCASLNFVDCMETIFDISPQTHLSIIHTHTPPTAQQTVSKPNATYLHPSSLRATRDVQLPLVHYNTTRCDTTRCDTIRYISHAQK